MQRLMKKFLVLSFLSLFMVGHVVAEQVDDVAVPEGKEYIYKETQGEPQVMEIYFPEGWDPSQEKTPGIILFHGGGWGGGSLDQFRYACNYFASRGLVAATVNYTLANKQSGARDPSSSISRKRVCIIDAKSAIRWFKQHADELGIDPDRIITGGGSAGGHICLLATNNPGLNDPSDPEGFDTSVVAYLLFNPALSAGDANDPEVDFLQYLQANFPPAIVFFGTNDNWKNAWDTAQQRLESLGNTGIDLRIAQDQSHAFFNKQPWADLTLAAADRFLVELGYLEGEPTLLVPETGEELTTSP